MGQRTRRGSRVRRIGGTRRGAPSPSSIAAVWSTPMSDSARHVTAVRGQLFDWANDTVRVVSPAELTGGDVTVVEDTLKSGFFLSRHHHERTTEIFFILDGSVDFAFEDETFTARV